MAKATGIDGKEWDLYADKGGACNYPYVKAKRSAWNPVKKQPRIVERLHGGRIFADGSVKLSKKFLERFPQFAGQTFYYSANQLLTREEYLALEPDAETAAPEAEAPRKSAPKEDDATPNEVADEAPKKWHSAQAGVPWAAWMTLERTGVIQDLQEVFGKEDGRLLADLAVYIFDEGTSMQNQEDWAVRTALPGLVSMDGRRISELLAKVKQDQIDEYYKRRFERTKQQAAERRKILKAKNPSAYIPKLTVAFDVSSPYP